MANKTDNRAGPPEPGWSKREATGTPNAGPGKTTSSFPADRATHVHHDLKGESGPNPSGRPFEQPGQPSRVNAPGAAVSRQYNWGSDAHRDHNAHGGAPSSDRGDARRSDPGVGIDRPSRRGASG
jgi:hypothetical protein